MTNFDRYEDLIREIMRRDGDSIGVLKDTGEIVRCHKDHLNCRKCLFSCATSPSGVCSDARAKWFNTEYHVELKDDLSNLKEWCDYAGIIMKIDFDEMETIHGASGLPFDFTRTGDNTTVVIRTSMASSIQTGCSVPSYVSKKTVKKILINLVIEHLRINEAILGLGEDRIKLLKQLTLDLDACNKED